jgi:ribosomal protein L32
MSQFQVLFSGQITDGASQDVVMQNLARSLRLDERKVGQLFSGRTVVVKSQLSREEAVLLQEQFSTMGAVARVKDLEPVNQAAFKVDRRVADHTLRDLTAAHQECPRCGHLQLESEFCARCGVDIVSHTRQSRKEDVLIAKKIREMQLKKLAEAKAASGAASEVTSGARESCKDSLPTSADSSRATKAAGTIGSLIRKISGK